MLYLSVLILFSVSVYDLYAANIQKEYCHMNPKDFCMGRTKVQCIGILFEVSSFKVVNICASYLQQQSFVEKTGISCVCFLLFYYIGRKAEIQCTHMCSTYIYIQGRRGPT